MSCPYSQKQKPTCPSSHDMPRAPWQYGAPVRAARSVSGQLAYGKPSSWWSAKGPEDLVKKAQIGAQWQYGIDSNAHMKQNCGAAGCGSACSAGCSCALQTRSLEDAFENVKASSSLRALYSSPLPQVYITETRNQLWTLRPEAIKYDADYATANSFDINRSTIGMHGAYAGGRFHAGP